MPDGNARPEPPINKKALVTTRFLPVLCAKDERHEKLAVLVHKRFGWQHANHCIGFVIQSDRLPDDVRISAEASLPQPMRDHHDLIVLAELICLRCKPATQKRRHAKNSQETRGDLPAVQAFGLVPAHQIHRCAKTIND